jgi:hypothetical protein
VPQFVIPNECEGSFTIKVARFLSHFVASKRQILRLEIQTAALPGLAYSDAPTCQLEPRDDLIYHKGSIWVRTGSDS